MPLATESLQASLSAPPQLCFSHDRGVADALGGSPAQIKSGWGGPGSVQETGPLMVCSRLGEAGGGPGKHQPPKVI